MLITACTIKAILLRVTFIIITIGFNWAVCDFIRNPRNNVFKEAKPLKLSLHVSILPLLAEISVFIGTNVFLQRHYGSASMSKTCLFALLIAVCPAICVLENHRMNEVKYYYGRWLCTYDCTSHLGEDTLDSMSECPMGNTRIVTCVRKREINKCFLKVLGIVASIPYAASSPYARPMLASGFFHVFQVNQDNMKTYPEFAGQPALPGMYYCNPPPFAKIVGLSTFKGCDVNDFTERIDQNNFWTFLCYYYKDFPVDYFRRRPDTPPSDLCSKAINVCRSKDVNDIFTSMTMQCRLAQLSLLLSVCIACWILPNYTLTSGKLPKLMLGNMLSAADIFDLLDCLDEPLAPISHIWSTVTPLWSASLLHVFCQNISSLDDTVLPDVGRPRNPNDVEIGQQNAESESSSSSSSGSSSSSSSSGSSSGSESSSESREVNNNQHYLLRDPSIMYACQSNSSPQDAHKAHRRYFFVFTEVGAILLSVGLQDFLFLCWRWYMLSRLNRYNTRIHFFVMKNILCLAVEAFRSSVLLRNLALEIRQHKFPLISEQHT